MELNAKEIKRVVAITQKVIKKSPDIRTVIASLLKTKIDVADIVVGLATNPEGLHGVRLVSELKKLDDFSLALGLMDLTIEELNTLLVIFRATLSKSDMVIPARAKEGDKKAITVIANIIKGLTPQEISQIESISQIV